MATPEQVQQLRRLVDDTEDPETYTNEELGALIDEHTTLDAAAFAVWEQKASSFSTMVNISESGSSRSMSDLYKNALEQAKYFRAKVLATQEETSAPRNTRIRGIERV